MKRILTGLILLLLSVAVSRATTYTAATASYADVLTAYNLCSSSGDTLAIPAGSATWTTTLTVSGKAITIQGNGVGSTNITDNTASGNGAINITCTATNFVRVTGMTWIAQNTAAASDGIVQVKNSVAASNDDVGFRIDNCNFTLGVVVRGMTVKAIYGLIDHCTFTCGISGAIHALDVYGSVHGSDQGYTPWSRALSLGTNKAVYVEDCTFDFRGNTPSYDDCIDGYDGMRVVVRYCTFLDTTQGFHGTDSGSARSPISFEIYNNTYTDNGTLYRRHMTIRGGTGVIYNNTYGGTHTWENTWIQYHRADPADSNVSNWQHMDGTTWQMGSASYSSGGATTASVGGGYGFTTATNEGLGAWGGSYTRGLDGTGSTTYNSTTVNGYPGRDQPGWAPGQTLDPIYIWGNTGGATPNGVSVGIPNDATASAYHLAVIQANREYYTSTSTAKPGYTAYTYPHPLIGGGDTTAPTPNPATIASTSVLGTTSFSVTATTATDETALGSAPYRFSSDNGSNWTSYQSSATYTFTGLTPNTGYQVKVQYQDAAGNAGTASSATTVTTQTTAPATPTNLRKPRTLGAGVF